MTTRVLLAKIGVDGHDRGVRVVAAALRDAGIEVIYTGPWQSAANVAAVAMQEDVDVIGISTLAGDYLLIPKLLAYLKEQGINKPVVVGGIIPASAEANLRALGIDDVFHPGADTQTIVTRIRGLAAQPQQV